jgi:3-oxoacyl-[acyl-carrier protein] reductase
MSLRMDDAPRVAVVTGAARGIGFAIARRLTADGHTTVLVDVEPAVADAAASIGARSVVADVSDPNAVDACFTEVIATHGRVDVLVNNAALTAVHRPWESVDPENWDRVMAVNARSVFLCSRRAVADMRTRTWGRIINLSSVTFELGQRHLLDYVSSKGAVVGFTRAFAREVGPDFITVNAISPGSIQTEIDRLNFPDQDAIAVAQSRVQAIPRRGMPEDIAAAVAFLAGDEASFITGQTIGVDGGWQLR